jgi:hypothetical protein
MLCEGCGNPPIDGNCACWSAAPDLKERLKIATALVKLLESKYNYCFNNCELVIGDGKLPPYSAKWKEEYEKGHYITKHDENCKMIAKFLEDA